MYQGLKKVGRSFESIRMSVSGAAHQWENRSSALREEDRGAAGMVAHLAEWQRNAIFYCFDDPSEALFFSALMGMLAREERHVHP